MTGNGETASLALLNLQRLKDVSAKIVQNITSFKTPTCDDYTYNTQYSFGGAIGRFFHLWTEQG